MPSYKTLAQILIATSAVGSALAAPAPAQEMRDARADLSQLDRRVAFLSTDLKNLAKAATTAGIVAGLVGGVTAFGVKYINAGLAQ